MQESLNKFPQQNCYTNNNQCFNLKESKNISYRYHSEFDENSYLRNNYQTIFDIMKEKNFNNNSNNNYFLNNEIIDLNLAEYFHDSDSDNFIFSYNSFYSNNNEIENEPIDFNQIEETQLIELPISEINNNNTDYNVINNSDNNHINNNDTQNINDNNNSNENIIIQEINSNFVFQQNKRNKEQSNLNVINEEKNEHFPYINVFKGHQKNPNILIGLNDEDLLLKRSTKEYSNTFLIIKRGRSKKDSIEIENLLFYRHTSYNMDNAVEKILNSCNKETYEFISKKLPNNTKFNLPTLKDQKGKRYEEICEFVEKTYYVIAIYSIPKRRKDQKKEKKDLTQEDKDKIYQNNKNTIDQIINLDQSKEILLLFSLHFYDYLDSYIYDKKFINKNGNEIQLEGFKTFGHLFNEGKKKFTQKRKEEIKQKIIEKILKK